MAARQAVKENLQCTSKYGHLRISQDICHVRMTDIEGFLTIYGHSDNLLNSNITYLTQGKNGEGKAVDDSRMLFFSFFKPRREVPQFGPLVQDNTFTFTLATSKKE